ncbi:MAG: metal-dependent hydrolase [Magnetococcales bacterium]|nr:metal-dependent hydrolase [Magnetococcales bacterium]
MGPLTHALLGWTTANTHPGLTRRERIWITVAGVVPDLDGLGILAPLFTDGALSSIDGYLRWHHVVAHNILFAVLFAAVAWAVTGRRLWTFVLTLISMHLHFLGDLAGSRGPDSYDIWPIYYLLPFSDVAWSWHGQWPLVSWQNTVTTLILIMIAVGIVMRYGRSPVELFSVKRDQPVVEAIQRRLGGIG